MATVICSICQDSLIKQQNIEGEPGHPIVPIDGNVNAVAAPCGHAYHSYCLTRWMRESRAPSCPNCRKPIPSRKCTALYLDTYDLSPEHNDLEETIAELNRKLGKVHTEKARIQSRANDLEQANKVLSHDNAMLNDRLNSEKLMTSDLYLMRYHEYATYKADIEQKDSELKRLKQELDQFKRVQNIVKGTRFNLIEELEKFPVIAESIKNLVEIKHVIQQDIECTNSKQLVSKEENLKLREKIQALKHTELGLSSHGNLISSASNSGNGAIHPIATSSQNNPLTASLIDEIIEVEKTRFNDFIEGLRTGGKRTGTDLVTASTPKLPKISG